MEYVGYHIFFQKNDIFLLFCFIHYEIKKELKNSIEKLKGRQAIMRNSSSRCVLFPFKLYLSIQFIK